MSEKSDSPNRQVLGTFQLMMINVAIVFSVRGFPMLAEEGLSLVFFLICSASTFFIPAALISAELTTGWPPKGPGGVYIWTKEALGEGWGFLAVWFQWIANVVWFPSLLSFIAATFAYIFAPSLAHNKLFILVAVLLIYWIFTLANCWGMKTSGWISTAGVVCTLLISGMIVVFGVLWPLTGHKSEVIFSLGNLIPDMSDINHIVLLAGAMVTLSGIELSCGHKDTVIDPKRTFPRAIFLSALISVILLALGSLSLALVLPPQHISLVSGIMDLFEFFFEAYHLQWLVPVAAVLVIAGSIGEVSSWIAGLAKGIFVTASDGLLPPLFQRENKHNVPANVLIIQAILVTILSIVFLYMPNVDSAYWILTALCAQLYLLMYILMFISAVVLRYTQSDTPRAFRIPPGNFGIWVVAIVGILGGLFTLFIGFFPPSQLKTGSIVKYEVLLVLGVVTMSLIPFLIYRARKPSWKGDVEKPVKSE